MRIRPVLLIFPLLLGLSGCYTVPETGRKSFVMFSPAQEAEMGAQSFAQLRSQEKVSHDSFHNQRVNQVGRRIAAVVGDDLPTAKWEFVVFDSPDVNAFALPGGKVGVYTGLLRLAETDDELATVIGHEIAHVTARHGAGATLGRVLPHSRANEGEADYIGLRYAAKAGYDPRAAITFWQKMARHKAQEGGGRTPAFLSTHPTDEQRIANLHRQVPQVLALYEAASRNIGSEQEIGAPASGPVIGAPQPEPVIGAPRGEP